MARNNSDFIDIKGLFRQYLSKWYWFAISVILCVAAVWGYTKIKAPVYAVRANVLISTDKGTLEGSMGALNALFGSDGYVEDEIFIVSSHSLYRDVARKLGLNIQYYVRHGFLNTTRSFPDYPVSVQPQAGITDTLRTGIQFKVKVKADGRASIEAKLKRSVVAEAKDVTLPFTIDTPIGQFTFAKTATYPANESVTTRINVMSYDGAAEALAEDISSEIASKRSNVIALGINTTNTEYGEAVLNEILSEYNSRGIVEKNNQGQLTAAFIDERLALLSDDLNKPEMAIQNYKENKGIIEVGAEVKYQTEKKALVEKNLIEAQTQLEILKLTQQFLAGADNAYNSIPMVVENPGLQDVISQYNELIISRNQLQRSARNDNSALVGLTEQIDLMRANINSALATSVAQQQLAVDDLKKEINTTESQLSNLPAAERDFLNLRRQQTVKAQLYVFLLQRREENSMLMANALPKGQIIDEAYTISEPLGMGKKAMLLIAFIFGLLIPPVVLYVRRIFHNRFETRQDVERMTDVPILGEMCIDKSGRSLVVASDDTTATAELFRLMRSNLLFILNDPRDKVVLLTSTSSGEGKSFISINLAASLALLNKRVVLIGLDIRNPRLADYLDLHPRYGVTQYLSSSEITVDQLIIPHPEVPGLDVICAGPVPPNPAELLLSEKVDELFRQLRTMYDYVIVDTAPIGLVSDTFTLDRVTDAAIYVCRANYTSLSDLNLINDIFEQHRLKKVSLVINGSAANKTYGYGKKKSHHN